MYSHMSSSRTQGLDAFLLARRSGKGAPHTHTRIGDSKLQVHGGAYCIAEGDEGILLDRHYHKAFVKGQPEHLTEKQLVNDGPLLVDLDFRYAQGTKEKQHGEVDIVDIVMCYANRLAEMLEIPDGTEIPVYVQEKAAVNQLEDVTKDGIHMLFGVSLRKTLQVLLRTKVLEDLPDLLGELPITNTWSDVVDEGVTRGHANWQLYGSRKPGHQAYLVRQYYFLKRLGGEWEVEKEAKKFDTKKHLHLLSARCRTYPKFEPTAQCAAELEATKERRVAKVRPRRTAVDFDSIDSAEALDAAIENLWTELQETLDISMFHRLKEAHDYTMTLPAEYYGPASYYKWIRVGWALASTSRKLFLTFLKFSAQQGGRSTLQKPGGGFDWGSVPDLFDTWKGFNFDNPDGLTHRSIMYWSRNNNREAYDKVHVQTIDAFIEQTVKTPQPLEFDIASVLFHMYKDRFVCVSIKNNTWYEYVNNRWQHCDCGTALKLLMSKEMYQLYVNRTVEAVNMCDQEEKADDRHDRMRKRACQLSKIAQHLKQTCWKGNIMKEAQQLFYDGQFMNKLDQNPHLLAFDNVVVDFKAKCARKGQPDDYISKSTNINYVDYKGPEHAQTVREIHEFMRQLFPNPALNQYMWQHLASSLIGINQNQTFNIYLGKGSNGKSVLVDLMSKCLGDYKETVPANLICQKRQSIGNVSPEISKLMGVRLACMQEMTKGDTLNEGIMKEITGGDPIQGRALYKDVVTFVPQFTLIACTNNLPDIRSTDDGTWRRIRICEFMSKFMDRPYGDTKFPKARYPHQFRKSPNLVTDRFPLWAPALMSMLVEITHERQGLVEDCPVVMSKSDNYRGQQDYMAAYADERLYEKEGSHVKRIHLFNDFKDWFRLMVGRTAMPDGREITEYINTRFGAYLTAKEASASGYGSKAGWHGIAMRDLTSEEVGDEEA